MCWRSLLSGGRNSFSKETAGREKIGQERRPRQQWREANSLSAVEEEEEEEEEKEDNQSINDRCHFLAQAWYVA